MHVLLLSTYTCFESFNACLWFYDAYFYYYPYISMCLKYIFIKKCQDILISNRNLLTLKIYKAT